MNKMKEIFGNERIVGLAGDKNSGKTNNLVRLIVDYRKDYPDTKVFAYGMPEEVMKFLTKYNVVELSSLKQMNKKKECILIVDEFQKLKLNDKRYKDLVADFSDFIYHRNSYVIFSSANIREFNSIIGTIIERWIVKKVSVDDCINGSQLKQAVEEYKGKYKVMNMIDLPKDEILVLNDEQEKVLKFKYIKEADTKKKQKELF